MKDYLKSSLFRQITREEAERMLECSKSQVREYTAGSVIFGEEDRSRYLYLLLDGKVQIAKHLPSGKRNLLFQIHELEVFGECFSVAGDEYCWYEAVAVKTSKVLVQMCIRDRRIHETSGTGWRCRFLFLPGLCGIFRSKEIWCKYSDGIVYCRYSVASKSD